MSMKPASQPWMKSGMSMVRTWRSRVSPVRMDVYSERWHTASAGAVLVSAILILIARVYTGLYRVDYNVKELGQMLLIVFALYAPVKVENMILGGGIIRSGGNTKIIMIIDTIGTWCIGIPLCMFAAYVLHWEIVGVYTLLTTEEIFRLIVSLVIFKKRKWMISLS